MSYTSIDLLTNLHTSESIYIPIHTQNTHWFTYVCHEKFIFLRDSMMKKITKNSRELAVWRVSTSQKKKLRLTPQNKSLRRPCGASRCARLRLGLRFGSVVQFGQETKPNFNLLGRSLGSEGLSLVWGQGLIRDVISLGEGGLRTLLYYTTNHINWGPYSCPREMRKIVGPSAGRGEHDHEVTCLVISERVRS